MSDWEAILDRFDRARVLVVGDLILDQYVWGEVNRISPEAPIPVVEVVRETFTLGGAANVASNLRTLGVAATIAGVAGMGEHGRDLLRELEAKGIGTGTIVRDPDRPTTLKMRIVAHKQQVVRVDREDPSPLDGDLRGELVDRIRAALPEVDAVILEDYGKGVIQDDLLQQVVPAAREAGKIITVDPKENHFDAYAGVTAITPNRLEAERATGIRIRDDASRDEAGRRLMERLDCSAVLLTLGERGMCLFERDRTPLEIPAHAREVFDVSGAGDSVIAVFTSALVAGATLPEAAMLSNVAGGLVVEKLGTATIGRQEIRTRLRQLLA